MRGLRPIVALTVLTALATLLLPPGMVCFALADPMTTACPMAAQPTAVSPCHGAAVTTAETRCCCSLRESTPPPLPVAPEAAPSAPLNLGSLDGLMGMSAVLLPPPSRRQQWIARVHAPPPRTDLFLHHNAFLL